MRRSYLLPCLLLAICAVGGGCKKPAPEASTAPSAPSAQTSGGVQPMTTAPIPNAPVAGAESVGGAGMGGLGQAAKDSARRAAGGGSSMDQLKESGD